MTPKEKADNLIEQMFSFIHASISTKQMLLSAKYCAIQTAKEMVFEYKQFVPQEETRIKYWEDVEAELRSR